MEKKTSLVTELASQLHQALQQKQPLQMADFDGKVEDYETAYAVQDAFIALREETVQGYKVSLTSEETQRMFDSTEPFYGQETTTQFLQGPLTLSLSELLDPLIEIELVFRAKEDLSVDDTLEDLLEKLTIAPGIEVPDSRFKEWFPTLNKYLVVSDCAVGGRVVFGQEQDVKGNFTVDDLANISGVLSKDGEVLKEGVSSEVLGNPLNSVAWLVKKLASHGKTLKKGQQVSSGTFILPPALEKGVYRVDYGSGVGSLELTVD
ncbi:2-keto-4-pentenoate hydratase [Streptococcus hyovaginalis]|uniref:2-keto-4-pentenoate hydratase n=1 Tax=Streptococcus hyovaginalis TaxID=149015 RepID=UPI002A81EAA8|nr:2-keto-4-pentenoate hydratase [Streptococcus hyovaginalis]MDY4510999.1 2-keto-4-pentenoate hydratase [Streptococcus hyovaginalis]MDY5973877.1 2-keto-4-pentenoate hydratase [Streptococcus hyovaginalis]